MTRRAEWILLRVIFGALLVWVVVLGWDFLLTPNIGPAAGTGDHATYMAAINRWLGGGAFYQPYQIAGPYTVKMAEILYPPTVIPLLTVMSFLPAALWWAIPITTIVAVVIYWRPSLLGWTAILGALAVPTSFEALAYGNPSMWMAAFVALGTIWGWPAALVWLKPTLAPFALIGVCRRSWWLVVACLAGISVLLLPLWFDYIRVLENARGPLVSPLYSLKDVPLMLIPIVARLTGRRRPANPLFRSCWSPSPWRPRSEDRDRGDRDQRGQGVQP